MKNIYRIFECPRCKEKLELNIIQKHGNDIEEGVLICSTCNKNYPIIQGIPIFKVGIYFKPAVRVRRLSRKQMRSKIIEAQSKKYFNKFFQYIKKNNDNYKPKGIIENKLLKNLVTNAKIKDSKIHLDWATGRGKLLRYIIKRIKTPYIVSIDLDLQECAALKKYLETTRRNDRVLIICGDTREMPFRNNSFESITTLWGIDEQREPKKAITESVRVLKSNRHLALSGALEGESFGKIEKQINKKVKELKEFMNELKLKNLKSEKIKYFFIYMKKKYPVISYVIYGDKPDI